MIADIIDLASKVGTFPMQVIMLLGLIILGFTIRYLHGENKKTITNFMERSDLKETLMTTERRERISMLMQLIKEDVEVKAKMTTAIDNNSSAISDLKEFLRVFTQEQHAILKAQSELFEKVLHRK